MTRQILKKMPVFVILVLSPAHTILCSLALLCKSPAFIDTLSRVLCYIVKSNPDAYQVVLSMLAVVDIILECPALPYNI